MLHPPSFARTLSPDECKKFVVRSILQTVTITPQHPQANSHDQGIRQITKNVLKWIILRDWLILARSLMVLCGSLSFHVQCNEASFLIYYWYDISSLALCPLRLKWGLKSSNCIMPLCLNLEECTSRWYVFSKQLLDDEWINHYVPT